ncbi:hypothetical protein IFT66_08630 [Rhizobium sp. CFBP 13726]|uniref:hypothetical protein n=1 Tax=Rhizobium sp. CFBP 13726 TaxID=2775296 RepID=UPI001783512B|nr:hypothetical protein [Rhizobium sp. CFBP 13726]MBD8651137.1 hypothetical protein [Rhizobium sp. CFBP 13726]
MISHLFSNRQRDLVFEQTHALASIVEGRAIQTHGRLTPPVSCGIEVLQIVRARAEDGLVARQYYTELLPCVDTDWIWDTWQNIEASRARFDAGSRAAIESATVSTGNSSGRDRWAIFSLTQSSI